MRPTQKAMANFNATIHFKKDGQIVANIPEGITLTNEGPYTLTVKKNMCVEMEIVLETAIDIHYVFETFSEVKFIEYRRIEQGGNMTCLMDVKAGAKVITLGNRILRTETVAMYIASTVMYELEMN